MKLVPVNFWHRLVLAIAISALLSVLILWGSDILVPHSEPSPPAPTTKLEAQPDAGTATPESGRKPRPPVRHQVARKPAPQAAAPVASEIPVAASSSAEASSLAAEKDKEVGRPSLPRHAQLTFNLSWGAGGSVIGETVHTLDIDGGHYDLHAVTRTVGLVRLFIKYELSQYSSGSFGKNGLLPERYFEETKESSGTKHTSVEFDRAAQRARFSNGKEMPLPPDTQDVLSNMYQFPPLQNLKQTTASISNTKRIEQCIFDIIPDEKIDTGLGKLRTVHLSKQHAPNQEGLEIWLAPEHRMFPVKLRFFNKQGEVTGEAIITNIRVSEAQGAGSNVAD